MECFVLADARMNCDLLEPFLLINSCILQHSLIFAANDATTCNKLDHVVRGKLKFIQLRVYSIL